MTGAMLKSARQAGPFFIREPVSLEDYVRKDTFDAHMQRMEALMERNLIEQRAMNERLNTKLDSLKDELKGDIKALETKMTGLRTELQGDMTGLSKELKGDMASLSTELQGDMASLRTELKGDIKALDAKLYALDGRLSQNLVITGVIVTIFGLIITAIQFWK